MRSWLEALECLFQPRSGVEVVIAHTETAWVEHAVARGDLDVVLMSLDGPVANAGIATLRQASPHVGIVVISDRNERSFVTDAVRAGVRGWVSQMSSMDEVVDVLRGVVRGETRFPPTHVTWVIEDLLVVGRQREVESDALSGLSTRELEILDCLSQGMSRSQIAERMFLSPHTVRTHINHVLHKLDVHSTLAAVTLARRVQRGEGEDAQRGAHRAVPQGDVPLADLDLDGLGTLA